MVPTLEESLIGYLLAHPETKLPQLEEADFQSPGMRLCWRSIEDGPKDLALLVSRAISEGWSHEVDVARLAYAAENSLPVVEETAKEIRTQRVLRDIREIGYRLSESNGLSDLEVAMDALKEASRLRQDDTIVSISDTVDRAIDLVKVREISTGYPSLDSIVGGLRPGELWILAGRPGMGKTSLASNLVMMSGAKTHVVSLEMPDTDLAMRWASSMSRVPYREIVGNPDPRVRLAFDELRLSPITIDSSYSATAPGLVDQAAKAKRVYDIDLMIVDYLQLCGGGVENRNAEIGAVTRALKLAALQEDICILALSQLNRNVEYREGNRPKLSDLRDSGNVEQDADVVIFCYPADKNDSARTIEVAKHRNGPTGKVELVWIGEFMGFLDPLSR